MVPAEEILLLLFRELLKEERRNPDFHRWCPRDESLATEGLRYEPAVWLQRAMHGRERLAWMRALRRTVGMGWNILVPCQGRTRFVQLTVQGLEQAERFTDESESITLIALWRHYTVWGKTIAKVWDQKLMEKFDWSSLTEQLQMTTAGEEEQSVINQPTNNPHS